MSTRASARKRKLPMSLADATTPRKSPRKMDTPDWLSDLDIHLSPKKSASSRTGVASVRKSSPTKRMSSQSPYVFGSSHSEESDASPQKINPKSFYSSKSKSGYLTPLERKQMREKLNKSADDANLTSSRVSPKKMLVKPSVADAKKSNLAAKQVKGKKVTVTKFATKSKVVVRKTNKTVVKSPRVPRKASKSPAKTPRKATKTASKKLPKKSPRRSVPRNKTPIKVTSANKGIHMYMQGLQKGKSAGKGKKVGKTLTKQEGTKTKKNSTPKKSTPKKTQLGLPEDDTPSALRGLNFGETVDEVEQEVTDIQLRIQNLIDTSFEESDGGATPKSLQRKRKMKTKEQSLEVLHPKKPRGTTPAKATTPNKSPRKLSTPRKSPAKQITLRKTSKPRKTQSATAPLPRKSPGKRTPQKEAKLPAKSGLLGNSLFKSQPDTPDLSAVSSQEKTENALSRAKEQTRMFPVFTPPTSPSLHSASSSSSRRSPLIRKLTDKDGKKQLTMDVGQKKFGTTICKTCSMVYTLAHPEDEANHASFHKKYLSYIKFPGWKKETVLNEFHDGRILLVSSDSPKYALKKIEEVRELVDHELGFLEGNSIASKESCKTLLFVTLDRKVAGCVIAEEITAGYRVIADESQSAGSSASSQDEITAKEQKRAWCCQTTPEKAVCGISRIWVTASMRRKNIGRRMVDCIRNNFVYGSILTMDDIAFSDPTPDGKGFATKYTCTPNFLVYKYQS